MIELCIIDTKAKLNEEKVNYGGEECSYDPKRYQIGGVIVEEENTPNRYCMRSFTGEKIQKVFCTLPNVTVFLMDCDDWEGKLPKIPYSSIIDMDEIIRANKSVCIIKSDLD